MGWCLWDTHHFLPPPFLRSCGHPPKLRVYGNCLLTVYGTPTIFCPPFSHTECCMRLALKLQSYPSRGTSRGTPIASCGTPMNIEVTGTHQIPIEPPLNPQKTRPRYGHRYVRKVQMKRGCWGPSAQQKCPEYSRFFGAAFSRTLKVFGGDPVIGVNRLNQGTMYVMR